MSEIDHEVLAKAGCAAYHEAPRDTPLFADIWENVAPQAGWNDAARAVVAALRGQGFAVVPRDDLEWANEWYWDMTDWSRIEEGPAGKEVYDRNRAVLGARTDDKETATR